MTGPKQFELAVATASIVATNEITTIGFLVSSIPTSPVPSCPAPGGCHDGVLNTRDNLLFLPSQMVMVHANTASSSLLVTVSSSDEQQTLPSGRVVVV